MAPDAQHLSGLPGFGHRPFGERVSFRLPVLFSLPHYPVLYPKTADDRASRGGVINHGGSSRSSFVIVLWK